MGNRGCVSLVGAGPGDPELLTVRGLDRIRNADVVIYDRLLDPRLLDEAPDGAERIFAGKASGAAVLRGLSQCDLQRQIEMVMVEKARAGKRVVRLKGGDPFVYGRGGEEVEALAAAGIPYEVVPGISSAIAAPASAGIPVTHRELSSTFTVVTGHEDPAKGEGAVDWNWLAAGTGTLVVLMGLERLPTICERLIAGGKDPRTPAAVVSAGTWESQQTVIASLSDLAAAVEEAPVRSPALIVVGDVVSFVERIEALGAGALAEAV